MWQYVVVCGLSCVFAGLAEYTDKQKRKYAYVFFSALSVFLGALLAGARASSVGTDVLVYGRTVFETAAYSSNPLMLLQLYDGLIEPLYLLLNFVVSRFTTDPHWFYFILQLLTLSFVYSALIEEKKNVSVWLGLLSYYALYYAFSLNGMRQAVAMSIIIWGMRFVYQKNPKAYSLCVLFATGFHYTAALFLIVYMIYEWLDRSKHKQLAAVLIVLAFCATVIGYQVLVRIISVFVPKYSRYLTGGTVELAINPLIIRLPFILVLLYLRKIYMEKEEKVDFWIVLLFGDAVFSQLRSAMPALYRMSLYFGLAKIHAYPLLVRAFTVRSRRIINMALALVLVIIWYYQVVLQGNDGAYPYASDVIWWLN